MREIKFRGRHTQSRTWLYGNLIKDSHGDMYIVSISEFSPDGHHLHYDGDDTPMFFDQETIGQFTGFRGKNGEEIYEGDILYTNEADWIAKVIWHYDGFMLTGLNNTGFSCSPDYDQCTVIGNIYENSEFLK